MKKIIYILTFIGLTITNIAYAWQNLADIQSKVTEFTKSQFTQVEQQNIKINVHKIDKRLTLADCDIPISLFKQSNNNSQSRMTVGVSCNGNSHWKIYVPVEIEKFAEIFYSSHPISRGQLIQGTDLTLRKVNIYKFTQGYFTSTNPPLGKIAKYQISPDMPITSNTLENPKVIKRGENITILAKLPGLNVKSVGIALEDGRAGDNIRVKNQHSKRIIQATVKQKGLVEVLI